MPNKAIKYRLYPSREQAVLFAKTFGCCRKIYNLMLADRIEGYKATGKFPAVTPARYKKDYPYLKEVDSLALANKQLDLQEAFNNRFSKTRKRKAGFPKFKSRKHGRCSYTTNCQYSKKGKGSVRLEGDGIVLPKTGVVKAVIHRLPGDGWRLKSATVSREPDGTYYASVLFEYEEPVTAYRVSPDNAVGLDYASDGLYVDSNGNKGTDHKYFRESQAKLAKAQRVLSRRKGSRKGEPKSANWVKQKRKVDRIHRHVSNQRLDNLHKLSTGIANRYDIVCVESLDMRAMSNKGFGNGKATMDNGYGMFLGMLEYKLKDRGKLLVRVDKWYPSSQTCSCCGHRNPELKNLGIRKWACPECGVVHDRDVNAAVNIRDEGLRMLAAAA